MAPDIRHELARVVVREALRRSPLRRPVPHAELLAVAEDTLERLQSALEDLLAAGAGQDGESD
jgi:hypothetical protein